jgi:hypothetical protein
VFNGEARSPHSGADFPSAAGSTIKAPNAGQVVLAENLYFSGNTVIVDHGLGLYSQVAHLSEIGVKVGDRVTPGQTLGKVGATGRVTGRTCTGRPTWRRACRSDRAPGARRRTESEMNVVIIGAGFAGAATAYALTRLGAGSGVILERESAVGVHASGRNAGLLKVSEDDAVIRTLAVRTAAHLSTIETGESDLVHRTGGLTLVPAEAAAGLRHLADDLSSAGVACDVLDAAAARDRFPLLRHLAHDTFDAALWCPAEGVVDVHALLTHYLRVARAGGFTVRTNCGVDELVRDGERVVGVMTPEGVIRADVVIDATGAWAGRLGRGEHRLPLPASATAPVRVGPRRRRLARRAVRVDRRGKLLLARRRRRAAAVAVR